MNFANSWMQTRIKKTKNYNRQHKTFFKFHNVDHDIQKGLLFPSFCLRVNKNLELFLTCFNDLCILMNLSIEWSIEKIIQLVCIPLIVILQIH